MGDIYNTESINDNMQEQMRRRAEIDATSATCSMNSNRLFWPGILFLFAGYSDFADEFCLDFIDPAQKSSESMIGPEGKIVQWNRVMAGLFLIGSLLVQVSTSAYTMASPPTSKESVSRKMILFLQCIMFAYILVIFSYSCVGMQYIFAYETPLACRRSHNFQDKVPYVVLWLFSVLCVLLYSVMAAFSVVMGVYLAFFHRQWNRG